jgi:hypothetical protein
MTTGWLANIRNNTFTMTLEYVKNAAGDFVCQHKDCNKSFKRQNTMFYHMKRHMAEFTYTCKDCDKGFLQKSAYLHHMAAVHPEDKEVQVTSNDRLLDEKIVNPYAGVSYKCPIDGCEFDTRTKANALVHYARLHAKDWIAPFDKEKGCSHCKKEFGSAAAYLYHSTGCVPANRTHRAMISRIIDNE